jgi:hypothetical protein
MQIPLIITGILIKVLGGFYIMARARLKKVK